MRNKATRIIIAIIISVALIGCGEEKSSSSNQGNNNSNGITTGGDIIAESQAARQKLKESRERAQAVLNAPPVERRTSDQVMGKTDEYSVPDYANMTGDGTYKDDYTHEDTKSTKSSGSPKDVTAKEGTVLFDEADIRITYQGIEHSNSMNYYSIRLLVENNSQIAYTVQARDCAVNGFMVVEPFFSPSVHPGMKENASMDFTDNNLSEKANVSDLKDIKELTFRFLVYESEDVDGEDLYSDLMTLKF